VTAPVRPAGGDAKFGFGALFHVTVVSDHELDAGQISAPALLDDPAQHSNSALVTVCPAGMATANLK
jgi:hypothetical protein